MPSIEDLYLKYCDKLKDLSKFRELPDTGLYSNPDYLDFSGNDYLNLSKDPEILNAAIAATKKYGTGSSGSRLLSGNCPIFSELEEQIAKDKKTENSLTFASGFQANSSILATLCDREVLKQEALLFFDKNNHSSLYQGAFLAKAELLRFQHNDLDNLEMLLQKHKQDSRAKFIVAETVYSMDGDLLDVPRIAALAKEYDCFLFLDEAHAAAVFGDDGYGLSSTANLNPIPHAILGTFSKGLGGFGAYLACSNKVKNYLINKCPGFIYSTAPAPFIAGAAQAAWRKSAKLNKLRELLLENSAYLRNRLIDMGLNCGNSNSQIIPIILGDEEKVMRIRAGLLQKKIIVSAIRPPTVPPGTSRLRLSLHSGLTKNDLNKLLEALQELL